MNPIYARVTITNKDKKPISITKDIVYKEGNEKMSISRVLGKKDELGDWRISEIKIIINKLGL